MAKSWKGLSIDWHKFGFVVKDNEEHVYTSFVGEAADVEKFKKYVGRLYDPEDRFKTIIQVRQFLENNSLRFSSSCGVLPGYEEEED